MKQIRMTIKTRLLLLALLLLPVQPFCYAEETAEALCEGEFHTLTFVCNNGTGEIFEVQVPVDEVTAEPAAPECEGLLFEGWYNDPAVGRKFDFGELLYMDRTLYAHWSVNAWKISNWFTDLVRGGSNIVYDADSSTLAFGAGELILNRQEEVGVQGENLEAGYYLGFRIAAPSSVTADGELWRIELDGAWYDINGPDGIYDGVENG